MSNPAIPLNKILNPAIPQEYSLNPASRQKISFGRIKRLTTYVGAPVGAAVCVAVMYMCFLSAGMCDCLYGFMGVGSVCLCV